MSDLLVVSHIVSWVVIVLMGVLLVAMMRQIGVLLLRSGGTTPLDIGAGPGIGEPAPWMPAGGDDVRSKLVAFLSTSCGTCDALVPALDAIDASYRDTIQVVAVAKESETELRAWRPGARARIPILTSPEAFKRFQVDGTPYAFVIDAKGTVAARGGVNHIEHLEALLAQCPGTEESDQADVVSASTVNVEPLTLGGSNGKGS